MAKEADKMMDEYYEVFEELAKWYTHLQRKEL
jgi:hypothetical protein